MWRFDHAFFHENFRLAERLGGFGNYAIIILDQFFFAVAAADTAPTPAVGGFQHDGVANSSGQLHRLIDVAEIAFAAWHYRYSGIDHRLTGPDLVAHAVDDFRRGADEFDASLGADFCQNGIFRKEAVAGMKGIATCRNGEIDYIRCVQVADDRIGTDIIGFIGLFDVQGMSVGIRIDGDGFNPHFGAGAYNANRNFATIGNKNFLDHARTR